MNKPTEQGPTTGQAHVEHGNRPDSGRTETSGMMGTIKEKAGDLASGAANVAGQVRDKAKELASSAASGAQHAWEATKRGTQEFASNAAETAQNAWEGLGDIIRRYPVPSLLIAMGAGFLLGGVLASRRS
jgi:ElaB/YqjD/DUF883 family membrane-anchored ribosome-binding protein